MDPIDISLTVLTHSVVTLNALLSVTAVSVKRWTVVKHVVSLEEIFHNETTKINLLQFWLTLFSWNRCFY